MLVVELRSCSSRRCRNSARLDLRERRAARREQQRRGETAKIGSDRSDQAIETLSDDFEAYHGAPSSFITSPSRKIDPATTICGDRAPGRGERVARRRPRRRPAVRRDDARDRRERLGSADRGSMRA